LSPATYERYERVLALPLTGGSVHVWCVPLIIPESGIKSLEETLSDDERARASRFHFPEHRRKFIIARGVLRYLLSHYVGVPPATITFKEGAYGKPELAAATPVRFNVSHSGDLALYAVSDKRNVGVDIEQHRTLHDLAEVAKRFFAPAEVVQLEMLPEPDRHAGFFRCWSRKEAFVKALGAGLSLALDSFSVSIDQQSAPRIEQLPREATGSEWRLFDITPAGGYSAALVTEGDPGIIPCARVEDTAKFIGQLTGKMAPKM
jgi:4'-phosphopantetheinyl transferase